MDLREKNIQWLTTITSDHHKTWNKMIERRKPNGWAAQILQFCPSRLTLSLNRLAIIQPWIEQIDEIVVELQVAYTQACWKKIQARKNYKKAVEGKTLNCLMWR